MSVRKTMNSADYAQAAAEEMLSSRSFWADARRRFFKNRMAVAALFFLGFIFLFAIFGGIIARFTIEEIDWALLGQVKELGGPNLSNGHWFGVDELGRDLYARVVQGSRVSLMVGFIAGIGSVLIGATFGAIAGYYGGRIDQVIMAAYNITLSIPYIIFFVVWQAFFGRSVEQMIIVLILINWTAGLLITRGQVMTLKNREFIEAAKSCFPEGELTVESWSQWVSAIKQVSDRKGRGLFMPLRKALTGMEHGPELDQLLPLIGRERTLDRLS